MRTQDAMSNDADNDNGSSLGASGTPPEAPPETLTQNDDAGCPHSNPNASEPHSSTAQSRSPNANSVNSATSLRTHQIINELLLQETHTNVTCSKSADNTNANANENGKKASKLKTSGNFTAAPSRRVSLLQNLAKIHPFSPSRTSTSQSQSQSGSAKGNNNANAMDEEQRAEFSCPEELCVLKVVAPLPISEDLVTSWNNGGGKIASRNESIASMIVDINRKESQMIQEPAGTDTDADGVTTAALPTATTENGATAAVRVPSTHVIRCTESDSMEGFCRICHDNPSKMTLIAPCSCKGSMGLVHRTCLERWLGESGKQSCEICNTEFITERRPRYTGCSAVINWLKNPLSPTDTRNLFFDLACFLVLTPLAAMSAWLCIVVITQDAQDVNGNLLDLSGTGAANGRRRNRGFWRNEYNNDPDNTPWTSIGLLTLTGTLLAAYYVWLYVAIKYHVQVWHEWQRHNYVVTIVPVTPGRERSGANAGGGAASSSSGSGQSSARDHDQHQGHHSDPGALGNTHAHAHAGAGSSDHDRGRHNHDHGARERSRSHSVGNRPQDKHKPGSSRSEAKGRLVVQMDPVYSLSALTEYHALLMASANFEDFSSPNSSSSSVPSIPSDSSGYVVTATHNARPQVMTSTILDSPDREVTIIEPASVFSLPNFSVNSELELQLESESEFVSPEAKLSGFITATATVTNIPEVVCISGENSASANNNDGNSSSAGVSASSSTQSVQEKPSSEVLT